jgi:hypothetical protein
MSGGILFENIFKCKKAPPAGAQSLFALINFAAL